MALGTTGMIKFNTLQEAEQALSQGSIKPGQEIQVGNNILEAPGQEIVQDEIKTPTTPIGKTPQMFNTLQEAEQALSQGSIKPGQEIQVGNNILEAPGQEEVIPPFGKGGGIKGIFSRIGEGERRKQEIMRVAALDPEIREKVGDIVPFMPFAIPGGAGVGAAVKGLQKIAPVLTSAKNIGKTKKAIEALSIGAQSGATEFVSELAKGGDLDKSATNALTAGVSGGAVALGLPLVGGGIQHLASKLAPKKETASKLVESLSNIPSDYWEEALENELKGKSLFRKKYDPKLYDALGKKAQKAINHLAEKAGKKVGKERDKLREIKTKINVKNITDDLENMIEKQKFEDLSAIERREMKIIDEFLNDLKRKKIIRKASTKTVESKKTPGVSKLIKTPEKSEFTYEHLPARLDIIQKSINRSIPKSDLEKTAVKVSSDLGVGILKNLAQNIDDTLTSNAPDFKKAKLELSEIKDLQKTVKTKLGKLNAEKTIEKLKNKTLEETKVYKRIDELAPKKYKFYEALRDNDIRRAFDPVIPRTRVAQEFSSRLTAIGAGAGGFTASLATGASPQMSAAIGGAGLLSGSPAAQRALLRRGGQVARGVKRALPFATKATALGAGQLTSSDLLLGGGNNVR